MTQNPIRRLEDRDYLMLNFMQKVVVYDMAGSVIAAIIKARATVCERCIDATKWTGETRHPFSVVTQAKEYTELRSCEQKLQIYVSDFVFHAILTAEISFRLYREKHASFSMQMCCNILKRILCIFGLNHPAFPIAMTWEGKF